MLPVPFLFSACNWFMRSICAYLVFGVDSSVPPHLTPFIKLPYSNIYARVAPARRLWCSCTLIFVKIFGKLLYGMAGDTMTPETHSKEYDRLQHVLCAFKRKIVAVVMHYFDTLHRGTPHDGTFCLLFIMLYPFTFPNVALWDSRSSSRNDKNNDGQNASSETAQTVFCAILLSVEWTARVGNQLRFWLT